MIPKVIHYCWFGGKPLPRAVKKCIKSWKKYCPGYRIIRWDESNFDITQNEYMRQAYEAKKWAFVTDVARLLILYKHGGIYLDTDVELIKPLDPLLKYEAYFGREGRKIATGLGFGACPGNPMVGAILEYYQHASFLNEDGSYHLIPCTDTNTQALLAYGLKMENVDQVIDGVRFLPEEYLCPINYETMERNVTPNTISIHHYAMSWMPRKTRGFFLYQRLIHHMKKYRLGQRIIRLKKMIFPKSFFSRKEMESHE